MNTSEVMNNVFVTLRTSRIIEFISPYTINNINTISSIYTVAMETGQLNECTFVRKYMFVSNAHNRCILHIMESSSDQCISSN